MSTQEATTPSPKKAGANKKSAKRTKAAKPKKAAKLTKAKGTRSGSKAEKVLELMKRKEKATLAEIAKATDWQNHSIRGFVSGHVTKKLGLKVESTKSEAGESNRARCGRHREPRAAANDFAQRLRLAARQRRPRTARSSLGCDRCCRSRHAVRSRKRSHHS